MLRKIRPYVKEYILEEIGERSINATALML
jgi:hypothetical protein